MCLDLMTSDDKEGHIRAGASYYILMKDYEDKHLFWNKMHWWSNCIGCETMHEKNKVIDSLSS